MPRTRLAPSPTGALHLGNIRTFLVNWAVARQSGWQVVLRIDDLDGPRVKPAAAAQAIDLLAWLGIDWDEGPHYQTHDLEPYFTALDRLAERGAIYPCTCTRKQIEAASLSAPQKGAPESHYPGTCRPPLATPTKFESTHRSPAAANDDPTAWRLRVDDRATHFNDAFAGPQKDDVQRTIGDFLVAAKSGLPSYQLAVVVDDARQGIDQVVRGDDLLASTHRQLHLYEQLDLGPPPAYTHLPLVVGSDGRRLAKRHGDTRVDMYRQRGVTASRIVGLMAKWCGIGPREEMTAAEFLAAFVPNAMPREATVFTTADDEWLR
ncbi:tRNA glutamyl-Q(34) synthetase GluQRS [Pirellulales bacterium]|nr:tRNA glutamyl-Q(34) synthetase GluQRS [Pirellulales bacterium]